MGPTAIRITLCRALTRRANLRLSLVTCPIELFPATSQAEKTHFHQINTQTGHRLRQQMVDEETGRVVDTGHKGRGTDQGEVC